jgi:hypothetical protein
MTNEAKVPEQQANTENPKLENQENKRTRVLNGPVQIGGEALANPDGIYRRLEVNGPLILTTAPTTIGYDEIIIHGPMLAPEGSETLLDAITELNGPLMTYPTSAKLRVHTGEFKCTGETLANPASGAEEVLVVVGQLFVTSPVEKVGYQQILIVGASLAPRGSEATLGPYLQVLGGTIWYPEKARLFNGEDHFVKEFFELLKEPVTLVLNGRHTIDREVTVDLLREKVAEIVLNGELRAPRHLLGMLQVLAVENNGVIIDEAVAAERDKAKAARNAEHEQGSN